MYHLARASALTARKEQAISYLRKAIYIDNSFDLGHADFESVKGLAGFKNIIELQKHLANPIINSHRAFSISDKTAHIEAITFDNSSGNYYLGAIHSKKIIRREKDGTLKDFTTSAQHGLSSVFGLKADAERGILWACSSPMREMENYDSSIQSAVFKFDLLSGQLLQKYLPNDSASDYVFGDLQCNQLGEVFVSDSKNNIIYKVNEEANQLDVFYRSEEFWNIQGICFSDDNRSLYISDYIKGPYRLALADRELTKLESSFGESLKGIDGLLFYNGSLIAIQNGVTPARVSRYTINSSLDTLTSIEILDSAHPDFGEPTTGVLIGNSLYYVANSPWGHYDEQYRLKEEELTDLVILRNRLK
ncbi:MAG: hypothetical protein RH860_08345 [Cytophagales bacterium]